MKELQSDFDFCVVGGGIAGMCAAIAAARHGVKTVLVHDRPVLGGNASSEVRMWICGAHGDNNRETGIVEELLLENVAVNPDANYSIWDGVLYGKARYQENLTLLLNTTCVSAEMADESRIKSIRAWEMNAETWHTITARIFADCSGDSVLAPLTGAEFRIGREARAEFGESIAPDVQDRKTMGMSCMIQARESQRPVEYHAPAWASKYRDFSEFPNRGSLAPDSPGQNWWWIELGGVEDCIHDTGKLRDELLKVSFGVWDLIKNHPTTHDRYLNWELDWVGFLPGKRESRRYVGDVIMNQNDVRRGAGNFPDVIAYGGWSMDDHHPEGLRYPGPPTIYHEAPSPYGIPYRSLYSRNIENLMFAGRNISATHSALSSTRVMATCGTLGQAVGTAVAIALVNCASPRKVYEEHLDELQQMLMYDDAWLPGLKLREPEYVMQARLTASNGAEAEGLRAGVNRIVDGVDMSWKAAAGDSVAYEWDGELDVLEARVLLDSDLSRRRRAMIASRPLNYERYYMSPRMAKSLHLEARRNGAWVRVGEVVGAKDRMARFGGIGRCDGLRLTIDETYGDCAAPIFAFDFRLA